MTDHANELRRHARKIPHPQGETPGVMLRAADEIERLQRVIASPHSMTRDEVIRMAREAWTLEFIPDSDVSKLERFASLVAAAEREARAKVCEEIEDEYRERESLKYAELKTDAQTGASDCAYRIRARGDIKISPQC